MASRATPGDYLLHAPETIHKIAMQSPRYYIAVDSIASFGVTRRFVSLTISRVTPNPRKRLPPAPLMKGQPIHERKYMRDAPNGYVATRCQGNNTLPWVVPIRE